MNELIDIDILYKIYINDKLFLYDINGYFKIISYGITFSFYIPTDKIQDLIQNNYSGSFHICNGQLTFIIKDNLLQIGLANYNGFDFVGSDNNFSIILSDDEVEQLKEFLKSIN